MKTPDPHPRLTDVHHRLISYLRVSVTDRCNLRCRYCMTSYTRWLPKGHILTLEEIHRMVHIGAGLGITKIRLTGGEPLCRKGIVGLVDVVNKPMYATAVGLVIYGSKMGKKEKKFRIRDKNIFNRVTGRMKKWFKEVV